MAQKTTRIRSKERLSRNEVAEALRQMANSIADNKLTLRQGGEEVSAVLPESLAFKVKLQQKDKDSGSTKHELEIEIEWPEGTTVDEGVRIG
jgi:amphi-Trp domain-containing protein